MSIQLQNKLEKPTTLKGWQDFFQTMYEVNNRVLSLPDIWLHLMEQGAKVSRDMRKENFRGLRDHVPHLFAWLCAFCNSTPASIKIDEAVWGKYPRICPYCRRGENCICIALGSEAYDRELLKEIGKNSAMPTSFSEWHEMFHFIYGNVNMILSRASVGFHLMEEIGEVARFINMDERSSYMDEVADVFAWIMAIPMKMPEVGQLDDITWRLYQLGCYKCKFYPCDCVRRKKGPRKGKG